MVGRSVLIVSAFPAQCRRVQLPPKLLKVLLFGGPSRETSFLICTSTSNLTGPRYVAFYLSGNGPEQIVRPCATYDLMLVSTWYPWREYGNKADTFPALSFPSLLPVCVKKMRRIKSAAFVKHQGYQCEVRYRGSFLCRAVPLPMLAHTLHRVLRGWLSNRLRKYSFPDILAMIQKLIAAFRPTEQVSHTLPDMHVYGAPLGAAGEGSCQAL